MMSRSQSWLFGKFCTYGALSSSVVACFLCASGLVGCTQKASKDAESAPVSDPEIVIPDDAPGAESAVDAAKKESLAQNLEPMQPLGESDGEMTVIEVAPADAQDGQPTADEDVQSSVPAEGADKPGQRPVVTLGDPKLTHGIPGEGSLTLEHIRAWIDQIGNHAPLDVRLPMGLAAAAGSITGLDQNPLTLAKIELGRQLYLDPRLSSDGTTSCATCHHPDEGYGRHTQFGEGVKGQKGNRNSPVSYNRILGALQFWDGRAPSLEEQAKGPIANPIEMGNTHAAVVQTLKEIDGYAIQFDRIFPGEGITIDSVAKAIASFERVLVTGPTPYDYLELKRTVEKQYEEDELSELEEEEPELFQDYQQAMTVCEGLSESAVRGRDLFFSDKSGCTACHAGANFTDELYHNLGVGMDAEEPDLGRFVETKVEADRGAFKTPTLRNVALSGPYMHDGSQAPLDEVVEWYAKGGHPNSHLSDKIKKLDLSDQDKQDLVAFMKEGLLGSFPPVNTGRLPE